MAFYGNFQVSPVEDLFSSDKVTQRRHSGPPLKGRSFPLGSLYG